MTIFQAMRIVVALVLAAVTLQHHEVRPDRLPRPFHTQSAGNPPRVIDRPANANLVVPDGFRIELWAEGFTDPRNMILAPNGDLFVADMAGAKVFVLRGKQRFTFAEDLDQPFGLAIRGKHLYFGNTGGVYRFDYETGQTRANG